VTLAAARTDGRAPGDLRPLAAELGYLEWAEGSVLLSVGKTRVLAAASYEPKVPKFLAGSGTGWVTAEYSMLPRATSVRTQREVQSGRPSGRTQEIQRLVGRSLRSVIALERLGECTFWIDCDVLQADGGTRTASITAGYLALAQAVGKLAAEGAVPADALVDSVAAVSVGIVGDELLLDLCYEEDARAEVDFNVVMTGSGELVEVQGTAEGRTFSRAQLDHLIDLAAGGIRELTEAQRALLAG
jgi:ribonuclease PH